MGSSPASPTMNPPDYIDEETGEIKCVKCGFARFDVRPKKIRRHGKIWQRIVCVKCGDWFMVDAEEERPSSSTG